MAKKYNSSKDLIVLFTLIVAFVTFITTFLVKVNKYKLWKSFVLSTSLLVLVNHIAYNRFLFLEPSWFIYFFVITMIYYGVFWNNKFTFKDTHLNEEFWQERQWWWTLDGWQFEQEVARIFRLHGYKANVTKGSGDGGVDIIVKKDGKTFIIQCKHYKNPLGPEAMRALWGCKEDFNADKVIMVASSGLSKGSLEYVSNKSNYLVLNLDDIIRMVKLAPKLDKK
jgi:restriction system protein